MALNSASTHVPLFARIVCRALLGRSKDEVLLGDADSFAAGESVTAIARGSYRNKEAGGYSWIGLRRAQPRGRAVGVQPHKQLCGRDSHGRQSERKSRHHRRGVRATRWGFTMANRRFLHTGWSVWRFDRRLLNWLTSFGAAPYEPASRRGKNITTAEADLR